MKQVKIKEQRIRMLLLLISILITTTFYAQNTTIKGSVWGEDGQPVVGAAVIEVGSNNTNAVLTDADGAFIIKVPPTAKLLIKYIGYADQNVSVANKTNLKIILVTNVEQLDEVVMIGYSAVNKKNVVGSIAQVDEKALADRPVSRVEQALQGQMAGVSVRSTSGAPGSDVTISVRGAASISGSTTPLYIVDGVPLDNLSGINPGDIASIDVLKDAASAAIYGSRGSNGVILVTTKRGKTGKPVITFNAYTAYSNRERKVDVMNSQQWVDFNKKFYDRYWVSTTGQPASVSQADRINYANRTDGRIYSSREDLNLIKAKYGIYDPAWTDGSIEPIDWQDALFRTAPSQNAELSASGATDVINYSLSAGVLNQDGIVVGSSFARYNLRTYIEANMSKRVTVGFNMASSFALTNGTNVDGKDQAVARALSLPGWVPAGAGAGAGAEPYKFYDMWGPGANNMSPYIQATENKRVRKDIRMNSAVNIKVNIIDGLDLRGLVAWNYRGYLDRSYSPTWIQRTWDTAKPGQLSSASKNTSMSNSLMMQGTATYKKVVGIHTFDALIGASQEKNQTEGTQQGQSGFANDKTWIFNTTSGTTTTNNTISFGQDALVSFFGRVQYSLKDRYLLSASLRSDGSSKFGPDSRWGTFPAISGAWRISEESFAKSMPWLSSAKLRLSWGVAGNDRIGSGSYLSNMGTAYYPEGDDQSIQNAYTIANIANYMLRWEKTTSTNVGLDVGVLKNRISFSSDIYTKKTADLLLKSPLSLTTGFGNMMDNVGNVDNWGMEFQANSVNLTGAVKWNTSFNISFNRNKITKLGTDNADIHGGTYSTLIQRVGYPINSYYLLNAERTLRASDFESDGVTPKPGVAIYKGQRAGDTKWTDCSGANGVPDGKIDSYDYGMAGNYQPKFEWGLTNTLQYKNFDMSIMMQGRVGGDLLSIGSRSWNKPTNSPNWNYMSKWLTNAYWSEDDPGDGKTPAFYSTVTGGQYDTNWIYDAGYIRLKNITLGYTIPVNKTLFTKLRIYTSVDNVYMWDHYTPGFSPEAANSAANSDWGSYPLARTFSFGVNASF